MTGLLRSWVDGANEPDGPFPLNNLPCGVFAAGERGPRCGVAIGRFTDLRRHMHDGALGFDEVLATYFGPLGIPVAYGFPLGHIDDQWTLPLGVRARLDADAGELDLLEPAVS